MPNSPPAYILDPKSDPNRLSDQLKLLSLEAALDEEDQAMSSARAQRNLDLMLPIVGYIDHGKFVAVATCGDCHKESRWTASTAPHHPIVSKKFRDRKWQISRKSMTCPTCVNRKRDKATTVEFKREPPLKPIGEALREVVQVEDLTQTQFVDLAEGVIEMPEVTTMTTDKTKAAKRQAYGLLLDHYDADKKCYQGDWSDKAIAAKTGLSEPAVAKIREDDFGPAGPPPQLIDLKARISKLEDRFKTEEGQMLRSIDRLGEMQKELDGLKASLGQLAGVHGWEA